LELKLNRDKNKPSTEFKKKELGEVKQIVESNKHIKDREQSVSYMMKDDLDEEDFGGVEARMEKFKKFQFNL
jgi:hypothetical protein